MLDLFEPRVVVLPGAKRTVRLAGVAIDSAEQLAARRANAAKAREARSLSHLSPEERAERRRAQMAEAKARQSARLNAHTTPEAG